LELLPVIGQSEPKTISQQKVGEKRATLLTVTPPAIKFGKIKEEVQLQAPRLKNFSKS
jgi:hypothetical protein